MIPVLTVRAGVGEATDAGPTVQPRDRAELSYFAAYEVVLVVGRCRDPFGHGRADTP